MSKLNAFLASVPANGLPSPALKAAPAFPELSLSPSAQFQAQPATPQPPQRRRKPLDNQEEPNHALPSAVTPMKPKPRRLSAVDEPVMANSSEAGPMRRLSRQGSHHRRVSTDTTMFSRYLRQHAHLEVTPEAVEHFGAVPLLTTTEICGDNNEQQVLLEPGEILKALEADGDDVPRLSVANALEIVRRATNAMALEPNVLTLRAPTTLVGDLHGQFQDLLEIFRVHGLPARENPFLFLGDYVDRGVASCEIILLLLAFKAAMPDSVHLLRGNHECRSLSTFYGFRSECLRKYGRLVYNRVVKCFESMPLAARLETDVGSFLAVHGGLSPEISRVDDINASVNRFMEPEPTGALCDLLWSDPAKETSEQDVDWAPNNVRGCSFTFNEHACREFLKRNNLLAIIRAHELEEEGFREHFSHSPTEDDSERDEDCDSILDLPPVITVFSAPEYCNTNHNMGATLQVAWKADSGKLLTYKQHTRSCIPEREFHGESEDEAMHAFLAQHLPFLPVDFYDLVRLCRQLRLALQQSSQSLSLVSSLCAREDEVLPPERDDRRSDRRSTASMDPVEELDVKIGGSIKVEGTTRSATVASAAPAPSKAKMMKKRKSKTSSENSDASGVHAERSGPSSWKFCPGVVRVYERWFGHRSKEPSSSPDARSTWFTAYSRRFLRRSISTGEADNKRELQISSTVDESSSAAVAQVPPAPTTAPPARRLTRRKSLNDWSAANGSMSQVAALTSTLQGRLPHENERTPSNPANLFSEPQWQALKLYFSLLDVNANGVLMEESFVVLLAEQDSGKSALLFGKRIAFTLTLCVIDCRRLCDGGGARHLARSHGLQRRRTHHGARLSAVRVPRIPALEARVLVMC